MRGKDDASDSCKRVMPRRAASWHTRQGDDGVLVTNIAASAAPASFELRWVYWTRWHVRGLRDGAGVGAWWGILMVCIRPGLKTLCALGLAEDALV